MMRESQNACPWVRQGFTLIDLIVSIGIFALVATSVAVNFNAGARNDSVRQAANIAAGVLRRAQSMTLSGATLSDGTFPRGGYGVRFDASAPSTLTLFADKDGNFNYTDGTEELEDVALPKENAFSGGTLNVVFGSPDADVYFNGVATESSKTISITAPQAGVTQSVIIYRLSGQVRVQ
ncbi:MAG: type II secretion system protein [Parcubacteria group bacterium]|nr:type II secretion system protein [Parcubacteria group bacterium]